MASKRHERTTARRVALQVLYTAEIKGASAAQIVAEGVFPSEEGPLSEYAQDLVRGVEQNRIVIDGSLKAAAENWSLGRMPIVDRSILRLAAYEIMFVEDVPTSVAINEAVELAKDFGGEDDSPRFVNGVLGKIARSEELPGEDLYQELLAEDRAREEAQAAEAAAKVAVAQAEAGVLAEDSDAAEAVVDSVEE